MFLGDKAGAVSAGMLLLSPGSAMYAPSLAPNPQQGPQHASQHLPENALVQVLLPPADGNMVCCDPNATHLQNAPPPNASHPPPQPQQTQLLNTSSTVSKKRKLSQDGVHVKLEPTPPGVSGTFRHLTLFFFSTN